MKLKMLLLLAASVSAVIVVACSEVVFPTPLPTATPAPTATPIVFPTPLPTATPFSIPSPLPTATPAPIIFPTPLPTATPAPTATPVSIPSPLPTATPSALTFPTPLPTATPAPTATPVAFPTPLPTATPAPTAFAGIGDVRVVQVHGQSTDEFGVGFAFKSSHENCSGEYVCFVTVEHVAGPGGEDRGKRMSARVVGEGWSQVYPLPSVPLHSDDDLDLSVVMSDDFRLPGVSLLRFAPPGTPVSVNDPVRVVATDPHVRRDSPHQRVLDGVVSDLDESWRSADAFVLTAETFSGNSGAVVLNADMQVVGMIVGGYPAPPYERGGGVVVGASARSIAVHVDAIRGKLCEWGYLTGRDCG